MQMEDDNNKSIIEQAQDIVNGAFDTPDHYRTMHDTLERALMALRLLKPYQMQGLHNLVGFDVSGLIANIEATLFCVDSPYDDDDNPENQ